MLLSCHDIWTRVGKVVEKECGSHFGLKGHFAFEGHFGLKSHFGLKGVQK